jgi:hypothetical protein
MSAESENFRELRRLLVLKRYEQPPPGYFNDFSAKVIAQIEAGAHGRDRSLAEHLFGTGFWLSRLWGAFGTKPILAGAFGVTVCSVLIAGVAYSDRSDSSRLPPVATPNRSQVGLVQLGGSSEALPSAVSTTGLSADGATSSPEERTSLFQEVQHPRAQLIMEVVPQTGGN